jgi:hypothetical protein
MDDLNQPQSPHLSLNLQAPRLSSVEELLYSSKVLATLARTRSAEQLDLIAAAEKSICRTHDRIRRTQEAIQRGETVIEGFRNAGWNTHKVDFSLWWRGI